MFYSFVEKEVKKLYDEIVFSDLMISLESFIQFVYFYIVAETLQSQDKQYSLISYTNMISHSKKLKADEELFNFLEEYERVAYHYTNLNHGNQIEAKKRAREEKKSGKATRFNPKLLHDFQQDEFLELMKIKSNSAHEFHKTYKRLVSTKGYKSRITFTEYRKFYEYLLNLINEEDSLSNIRYYKLEKRMNFEIQKTILMAMKKRQQITLDIDVNIFMNDLLAVTKLPIIDERHRLVDAYLNIQGYELLEVWRTKVRIGINKFINHAIQYVKYKISMENYNVFKNVNWDVFYAIYRPESYSRDYKLRRDFNASDFKKLMSYIDSHTEIS